MEMTLRLLNPAFDDNRLSQKVKDDFGRSARILVYKDVSDWRFDGDEDSHAFSLWIEYNQGLKREQALMFDIELNDLEEFANSILKSIELLRRDHGDTIKNRWENGCSL